LWLGYTQTAMTLLAPSLKVDQLSVAEQKDQLMFVGLMSNKQSIVYDSQTIPADTQIQSSTLVGNAIQAPIIMLCLIFSWPSFNLLQRLIASIIAIPIIFLIAAIDIPLVLIGSAWDCYYSYLDPEGSEQVFSTQAMYMLNNGGRLALAIAAALGCVYLQSLITNNCVIWMRPKIRVR
jgi:hypothetical protein